MKKHISKIVGLSLGIAMTIGVGVGAVFNSKQAMPLHATETSIDYGPASFSAALPTDGFWTGVGGGSYCGGYGKNKTNAWSITLDFDSATSINWSQVDFDETVSLGSSVTAAANGGEGDVVLSLDNSAGDSISKDIGNFGSGTNAGSAQESSMNISSVTSQFSSITLDFPSKTFITAFSCSLSYTIKAGGQPVTFLVSYNSNGGTGTMTDSNSPYNENATVTVLDNGFSKDGYVFDHWDTKADDSGTDYSAGDTFQITSNVTLYAQWALTYSVTYDANGGTGTMTDSNSPYKTGTSVTLMDNSFTRTDYVFTGWNTRANGSGTKYDEGDIFNISSNTTLYAQWRLADLAGHTGTINFGSASGSLNVNSESVSGKDNLEINWTVTTTGTTSFNPSSGFAQIGSSSKPASTIVFEADLLDTYKVTSFSIDLGGYSGTAGNVTLKVGDTTVGSGTLSTTTDVTVENTLTAKDSSLSVSISNIAKGVKAYSISYTLASPLEDQTITASSDSANVGNNETITLTTNAASAAWSITSNTANASLSVANGKSTVVSATQEGSVTVQAAANGYKTVTKTIAFVTGINYEVTFDSNGGSESPINQFVGEGETFIFPSAGTKDNYIFDGWTSTGSAPYYAAGATSPAVVADIAYTAHWTEEQKYTVTFGTAEGTATLSNFNNSSYIIPSGVTLDNIQGFIYGKNDNTAAAIRFGKDVSTGSFDATIDSQYYIVKVTANLKSFGSDTNVDFAVTPNGGEAVEHTITSGFDDYEFDVSSAYTNKVTLGTTTNKKRAFLSSFSIEYEVKTNRAGIEHTPSASALKFNYTNIDDIYSFTGTTIRFGGFISTTQWGQLHSDYTIQGYGVLVAANSDLGGQTIIQRFNAAKESGKTVTQAIDYIHDTFSVGKRVVTSKAHPAEATPAQKTFMGVDSGDYYIWTVQKSIGDAFTSKFNAVAFILIDGDIVFLQEVSLSAKDIATRDVVTHPEDPALPALTYMKDH